MNWGGWFKYPLVPPVLNVYKQKTPECGDLTSKNKKECICQLLIL